jgi:hypothetical protein
MHRVPIFRRNYRGERDSAALEYLPELSAIWVTWVGALTPDEYQYVLLRALEVIVEHRCRILLIDAERQTFIDPRSNEWEQEKLHPELYASGLRLAAIRPPEVFLSKMSLEEMNDTLGYDIHDHLAYEVRFFATMDEALEHARKRYQAFED